METISPVIEECAELGRQVKAQAIPRVVGFVPWSPVVHLEGELVVWRREPELRRNS